MLKSLNKNLFLTLITITTLVSACSHDNSMPPVSPPNQVTSPLALGTSATFGTIFTDSKGRTLYFFANDAKAVSTCETGACAALWPTFYAGNETPPEGIRADQIGTITHADGTKQTTFNGSPLYYYAPDTNPGDIKGDGVDGIWFVGKPDYMVMISSQQLVGDDGQNYVDALKPGNGITTYITDPAGFTLYAFQNDTFNTNKFTAPDFSNNALWPIDPSLVMNVPSILKKDMFVNITFSGKPQLVFKGHPMYYFGGDKKRGDTRGISIPTPAPWPVLTVNTAPLTPAN